MYTYLNRQYLDWLTVSIKYLEESSNGLTDRDMATDVEIFEFDPKAYNGKYYEFEEEQSL